MTTPVDALTLLNRLMAMVEANVNPPDLNYRGNSAAYLQTHQALQEALRAYNIPFPFPWTTLAESASHLRMVASGGGSHARRRDEIRRLAAPAIEALSAAAEGSAPSSRTVPPPELRLGGGARWVVGERIGDPSGLGQVYAANDGTRDGAVKFIPKAPAAQRELLLAEDVRGARNVIPVIDSGEYGDYWVLVMPKAEYSLSQRLSQLGGRMPIEDALSVLEDTSDTPSDLANHVVHRDIKPQNILFYGGHWCLADFGISRYAEATTEAATRKGMWTPPYAAPEQWQVQRATSATDMYSLGITAYEMLSGTRPFAGPSADDFREQHLNQTAPELADVPTAIAALIAECLYKAPEARPRPADFRRRIAAAARSPQSPGLRQLRQIHLEQVEQRAAEFSEMTAAEEREQRRQTLSDSAQQGFIRISDQLRQALSAEVPDVSLVNMSLPGGWAIKLGQATLTVEGVRSEIRVWKPAPPFEVIATSTVTIEQAISRYGYAGRSHALWFGDIQHEGQFLWFEVAFMTSPLLGGPRQREPYALDPGGQAASAIGPGLTSVRLAWPFTPLVPEDLYLSDFIDRWAAWLAGAANGDLQIPSHMPERDPANSWRTS